MLKPGQLSKLRDHVGLLANQISLLEQKIAKSPELEEREGTQEEERQRLLSHLADLRSQAPRVLEIAETWERTPPPLAERLQVMREADRILFKIKREVETLAREHDECNLDLHKQEVVKAVELCREAFNWILPQIRNEIMFLEKFYGDPRFAPQSIMPELNTLLERLENHQISLDDFLQGYREEKSTHPGYLDLRTFCEVYSPYQFFDHSFETYRAINTCYYEICKSTESLLKEKKATEEFGELLERVRENQRPIGKMGDIFEAARFVDQVYRVAARKFAYTEEMKRVTPLTHQFHQLRRQLVIYNREALEETEKELNAFYENHADKVRYQVIMRRVHQGIHQQTLSFQRLETIFEKLRQSNFNIVVEERPVESLEIIITPHHEKELGRGLLERINIILQEIDFWYPPEKKEALLPELEEPIQLLQEDALPDRNEIFKRMQGLDREMERTYRPAYPERLRETQLILSSFQRAFSDKSVRDRFADRLANQKIWSEILPRVEVVSRALKAAEAVPQGKGLAPRFPHLKTALDGMCQLLYDLAMQLFVLFPGAEEKYVSSMASILFTCNEFHDIATLWAAFSHYHKKIAIPNFPVNESMIRETSKHPFCKARFRELSGQTL